MKLRIEINLDNAAFGDAGSPDASIEVARILRWLSENIEYQDIKAEGFERRLRDFNGNRVGAAVTSDAPLSKGF